ncbi:MULTISPECIES: ABC transporter ATP-binding protein [Alphaproteobacteria]|uniref:ABC transporter ATP-binding protein n=1 Tax=Alphaproteobacteria TaxID=28211 RepID=UPI0003265204|nr:ABC transporter ATP-binding protein [Oceanicaulis sp. HTCC2633]
MSFIDVKSLSVTYPLFNRASSSLDASATLDVSEGYNATSRLLRAPNGQIIGVRALRDVSFKVETGERVGLIGSNGSGKTTLLQVLAGIYPPDHGTVEVRGRTTSLVNINLGIRNEASGNKNITLRGLASGHSRSEIEARRSEIAAFTGLGEFLDLPVETYSAGMRMRLNFAIATAFEPEILILDEWLSAGDASFRKMANERMASFVGKAGIVILASHSMSLLLENCTRAIWLDNGTIRSDGPIKEVLKEYSTS